MNIKKRKFCPKCNEPIRIKRIYTHGYNSSPLKIYICKKCGAIK
jgi:RNase P subunit RPR2